MVVDVLYLLYHQKSRPVRHLDRRSEAILVARRLHDLEHYVYGQWCAYSDAFIRFFLEGGDYLGVSR